MSASSTPPLGTTSVTSLKKLGEGAFGSCSSLEGLLMAAKDALWIDLGEERGRGMNNTAAAAVTDAVKLELAGCNSRLGLEDGSITPTFLIGSSGRLKSVKLAEDSFTDTRLETCMREAAEKLIFPPSASPLTILSYTFPFSTPN